MMYTVWGNHPISSSHDPWTPLLTPRLAVRRPPDHEGGRSLHDLAGRRVLQLHDHAHRPARPGSRLHGPATDPAPRPPAGAGLDSAGRIRDPLHAAAARGAL